MQKSPEIFRAFFFAKFYAYNYFREYGMARTLCEIEFTKIFAAAGVYLAPIDRLDAVFSCETSAAMSPSVINPRNSPLLEITMSPEAGAKVPKIDCKRPTSSRAYDWFLKSALNGTCP